MEIGYALALHKHVLLVHETGQKLVHINDAMIKAGMAHELTLPLDTTALRSLLVG